MLDDCITNAEYVVKCAKFHLHKQDISLSSKWKSLHTKLQDAISEETVDECSMKDDPQTKHFRLLCNSLQKLCKSSKNLNRLIVNLFPCDYGYSLMLKTSSLQYMETIQLPYDQSELLNYIDNEQIPPLLIDTLNVLDENMFHSGCVIAEIRDYRIATSLNNFETKFVLLRPTQQTIFGDVDTIASETSHLYTWDKDEKLSLESYLVLATSEPLCLAPSPSVQVMKNDLVNEKRIFKRHSIKRCIRRCGMEAILRRKEFKTLSSHEPLKLQNFLQNIKHKRTDPCPQPNDIRLSKDAVNLWRKTPVKLSLPSQGVDALKHAKPLEAIPSNVSPSDLLEVQQVYLRSESQNRDVYSRISIMQRPSDMQYFGRLQSNKYFQPTNDSTSSSSNCSFSLGTENRANLYILQYQELFAEDGRRPATVVVNRPLQSEKVQYQIPFLHQPWKLEQEKSLFAVGSVNNVPTKDWHKLKKNLQKQKVPTNQHLPGNPLQRTLSSSNQNTVSNVSTHQLSSTTPTLNAATLQAEPSPFVFPVAHQVDSTNPSPRQHPNSGSNTIVERKKSFDTISLGGVDRNVYHLAEVVQPRRNRISSSQDIFTFPSINLTGDQSQSAGKETSHSKIEAKKTNTDSSTNISLPQNNVMNVRFSSSQPAPTLQNTVQLQGKVINSIQTQSSASVQQPTHATTVLRIPTTSTNAGQQLAINILGNPRSSTSQSQVVGNIELNSSSRLPSNTLNINSGQIPAEFALQLAAAANQLNQDKPHSSSTNVAQSSGTTTSGLATSGPITFVASNNQIVGTVQPRQVRSGVSSSNQSATLTYNPRTQILTANVRGTNIQQPVQFLQVSSSALQQLPIRIPGQQVMIQPVRTGDNNSNQLTLTQQLQLPTSAAVKRNRKRKATPDHGS